MVVYMLFYINSSLIFFSSINKATLWETAICWTVVWESAWTAIVGGRNLCYDGASIPFLKFLSGDSLFISLTDRLISLFVLHSNALGNERLLISLYPLWTVTLKQHPIVTATSPFWVPVHWSQLWCVCSVDPTLTATWYNLLFQTRNQWLGTLGQCALPLQNSILCLRSVKVCIYYAQLKPSLTIFLIVLDLLL